MTSIYLPSDIANDSAQITAVFGSENDQITAEQPILIVDTPTETWTLSCTKNIAISSIAARHTALSKDSILGSFRGLSNTMQIGYDASRFNIAMPAVLKSIHSVDCYVAPKSKFGILVDASGKSFDLTHSGNEPAYIKSALPEGTLIKGTERVAVLEYLDTRKFALSSQLEYPVTVTSIECAEHTLATADNCFAMLSTTSGQALRLKVPATGIVTQLLIQEGERITEPKSFVEIGTRPVEERLTAADFKWLREAKSPARGADTSPLQSTNTNAKKEAKGKQAAPNSKAAKTQQTRSAKPNTNSKNQSASNSKNETPAGPITFSHLVWGLLFGFAATLSTWWAMWYDEGAPPGWQGDPVFLAILLFLLWLGSFLGKSIERKGYPSTSKSWLISLCLIAAFATYLGMTWSRALEGVLLGCLLGISVWYGTRQIAPRPFLSLATLLSIFGLFFWKTGAPLPFAPATFESRLAQVQPFDLSSVRRIKPEERTFNVRNRIVSLGAAQMDWSLIDAAIHEDKLYATFAAPNFRDSTTRLVAQFLRPETQDPKEPKSIYEENLPNKKPVGLARYSEDDLKFLRVDSYPDKDSLHVFRFGFEGESAKSKILKNQLGATRESLRHSNGYGFITTDQSKNPVTMNYFYGPDFKDMNSVSIRRDGMYYLTPNKAFVLKVNRSTKSAQIAFARDESGPDMWIEIATIEPDASTSNKRTTNLLLKLPHEDSLSGLEISSVKATSEGYMIVAARRENPFDRAMGIDTGPDAVYVASVRTNGQLIWHAVYEDYVLNFGDSDEKVLAAADASGYAWLLPLTKNTKKSVDPSGYCVFTTYEPCTKFNTFDDPDFHVQSIVENKDEVAMVGMRYNKLEDSSSRLERMFKSSIWLKKKGKTPSFVNFKKNARELRP